MPCSLGTSPLKKDIASRNESCVVARVDHGARRGQSSGLARFYILDMSAFFPGEFLYASKGSPFLVPLNTRAPKWASGRQNTK